MSAADHKAAYHAPHHAAPDDFTSDDGRV